jgi:hypothetical protein
MSLDLDKPFHDDDATTIDRAIADSVVAHYVGGQLQTLAGHFQTAEPNQYASWYGKWGGSKLPVEEVPGFTDRDDREKPIKLVTFGTLDTTPKKLLKGATFESAVHETIHLNSNLLFERQFGWAYNEAMTEYFTLKVFGVQQGKGHVDKLFLASGLIGAASHFKMHRPPRMTPGAVHFPIPYPPWQQVLVGQGRAEGYVAAAYFRNGGNSLLQQVREAFLQVFGNSGGAKFVAWQHKMNSQLSSDWADADTLLHSATEPAAAGTGAGASPAPARSDARP